MESTIEQRQTMMPWASILIAGIVATIALVVANMSVRLIGINVVDVPNGFSRSNGNRLNSL